VFKCNSRQRITPRSSDLGVIPWLGRRDLFQTFEVDEMNASLEHDIQLIYQLLEGDT
jgi:hypothetical protein